MMRPSRHRRKRAESKRGRSNRRGPDRLGNPTIDETSGVDASEDTSRLLSWLVVSVCSVSALFLGLYNLGDKSLWGDEMNVIWFMTEERDLALSSGNGLIYIPVLRLMWWLGGTDLLYRLPAVFFGAACVPLVFCVAREMRLDRRTSSIATIFVAIAPILVAHMQQVHVYTLFCASSVLALLFYLRGRNGNKFVWWPACAVVLAVGFHVHLFSAFVALDIVLIHVILELQRGFEGRALERPSWKLDRRTGAVVFSTIVVCGAILWPLLVDWIIPLGQDVVAKIVGGIPAGDYFRKPPQFQIDGPLFARLAHQLVIWKTPYTWLVVLYVALAAVGLVTMAGRMRGAAAVAAVWLLVPPVPSAVFSYYSNIDFGSRRLIFLFPMLAICSALGVTVMSDWGSRVFSGRNRRLGFAVISWVLTIVVAGAVALTGLRYYYLMSEYPDVKRCALLMEDCARESDIVMVWRPERYRFYYRGDIGILDISSIDIDQLRSMLEDGHRIWYVRNGNIDRWELYEPVAKWFAEQEGWTFPMGGGLRLTFVPSVDSDREQRLEEIAEVVEGAVAVKRDRYYLHLELAEIYKQLGRVEDFKEQRRIGRTLRGR